MDKVRVIRVIEYIGPRNEVEKQLLGSIQGDKYFPKQDIYIKTATIGSFPEILERDAYEPFK